MERLHVRIIRGLARPAEVQFDVVPVRPVVQRLRGELRPVVDADPFRQRSLIAKPRENTGHIDPTEASKRGARARHSRVCTSMTERIRTVRPPDASFWTSYMVARFGWLRTSPCLRTSGASSSFTGRSGSERYPMGTTEGCPGGEGSLEVSRNSTAARSLRDRGERPDTVGRLEAALEERRGPFSQPRSNDENDTDDLGI